MLFLNFSNPKANFEFLLYTLSHIILCIILGGSIPNSIKLQVLNDWLLGKSRDDIAINNGISNGTVFNIIKEVKNRESIDFDLVRVIAVHLKKEGHTLTDLASSIHLRNMLDMLELPEERVEKFLLALSICNYKHDIEKPEKFIEAIEKISQYVHRLDVPVFNIIEYVENQKIVLQKLKSEISSAKQDLERIKYKNKKLVLEFEKFKKSITDGDDEIH